MSKNDEHKQSHAYLENKSAKNRISKIGTAIKSAAEYGLVDGVGKTAKNFAGGVSAGAKQGYGYFTTDINMHAAVEDTFQKVEHLANIPKETAIDFYQNLSPKQKFTHLIMECADKYTKLKISNDQNKLLSDLEAIVQNQIKNWSVLTLGNQYNNSLTKKSYTDLSDQDKLNELTRISLDIFNKMYDKRAKQPEFIETTRKIERLKEDLDKRELPNLAGAAGVSNGKPYQNAQTYEEKITLIEIALKAKQNKHTASHATNPIDLNVQQFADDQQLTNTSFEKIKKTADNLRATRSHNTDKQHPIDLQLQRLETAKQTLAELRAAEAELLHPKQNRVVRILKTAAGLMAGATIGGLKGSGTAIKTAAKAVKNAPSGIKKTYQKNRSNKQNSR